MSDDGRNPSDSLSVVFDLAALARGGMERQLIDVARGLQDRGHAVTIVVNKSITAYGEELDAAGVETVELGTRAAFDPTVFRMLRDTCRVSRADVLVGVNFNATFWSRIVARSVGCGAVAAEHSTDRGRPWKVVISNRALSSTTDAVIACAEAQVASLVSEGMPAKKIAVVRNGVNGSVFARDEEAGNAFRSRLGLSADSKVVAFVAAHRPEKRFDRFVDLIEKLAADGRDIVGVSVGGGPLLEAHRGLAAQSSVSERIRITGAVSDVTAAYSAADVCVLCSSSVETFPLTMLESQSCATPVVGMRVGGVEETFVDGATGILVEQGDQEAFAREVACLLDDPVRAREMGVRGAEWVREARSLTAMIDGYERVLWAAALASRRRRS